MTTATTTPQAPSALALLRPNVSARTWIRGESYFDAGAVTVLETGPGHVHAVVAGTGESAYSVELRWAGDHIERACSCPYEWGDVCKHQIAVAFALERSKPIARSASGDRAPGAATGTDAEMRAVPLAEAIEEARSREIETRAKAGRSDRLSLLRVAPGPLNRYLVHSAESDSRYEVLLLSDDFAWCACLDHRTSELPTCKHIACVLEKRRTPRSDCAVPVAVLSASDTEGAVHAPLGDVRVYLPASSGRALGRIVDDRGFVVPSKLGAAATAPARLRETLARVSGLVVWPHVEALLASTEASVARARRFAAFERRVRATFTETDRAPLEWRRLVESLRLAPHAYQIDGILFAARTDRALLGDDMGLGKTYQALAATRLLSDLGEVTRAIVVCPASVKHQWAKEARKILGDGLAVTVVEGNRKAREAVYQRKDAGVLILNYELLWSDLAFVRGLRPDLVIVDEAQRIKNWNTRTAKCVKAIESTRALVLTGTPLENRLAELHSIAEYLDPRALGPMWRLAPEHTEIVETEKGKKQVAGFRNLDLLRKRLAPRFLRRERSTVLDQLPPRTDQSFSVELTAEQGEVHEEHRRTAARILAKKYLTQADVLRLMAALTQMRLVANGLLLYHWERVSPHVEAGKLPAALVASHPSPKLAELASVMEQLLATRDARIVVFSQWERMLRLSAVSIAPVLTAAGVKPLFFHGQLSSRERAEVINDFHEEPQARVLFSTDAGGIGLNLQEAASTVVHLELPWNPALFEQRIGRIHRMGQRRPIQVITLVTAGSVESRIAAALENKRALFDGLFRGDEDEIRFDDGARAGIAERLRALLGTAPGEGDSDPPTTALVELQRPVDETIARAPTRVADIGATAQAGPIASHDDAAPEATSPPAEPGEPPLSIELDLGRVLSAMGLRTSEQPAQPSRTMTLRRERDRLVMEIPEVPDAAWEHLRRFVETLAG